MTELINSLDAPIGRPKYQDKFERHYNAILGMFRHLITQFADESVEIAARAVALAAPLPNAINMYNVAVRSTANDGLGYGSFASLAFALTLEIVVFLLVEIALKMWDGYLVNHDRYVWPFRASIAIVILATLVVMGIVYVLEPHKIMAFLPVVSLCSFVGIGLKRWDERNAKTAAETVQSVVVPEVQQPEQPVNDDAMNRRKAVATYYKDNPNATYQQVADDLNVTSKATVFNDVKWLEKRGVVHVERDGKTTNVRVNGQYETFVNG
jgi:hypothetical protein